MPLDTISSTEQNSNNESELGFSERRRRDTLYQSDNHYSQAELTLTILESIDSGDDMDEEPPTRAVSFESVEDIDTQTIQYEEFRRERLLHDYPNNIPLNQILFINSLEAGRRRQQIRQEPEKVTTSVCLIS